MADIVDRLRARLLIRWSADMSAAADEIESLRSTNARLSEENAEWDRAYCEDVGRLRGALEEIVAFDSIHYAHDGNARIVNIARTALSTPSTGKG